MSLPWKMYLYRKMEVLLEPTDVCVGFELWHSMKMATPGRLWVAGCHSSPAPNPTTLAVTIRKQNHGTLCRVPAAPLASDGANTLWRSFISQVGWWLHCVHGNFWVSEYCVITAYELNGWAGLGTGQTPEVELM